MAASTSINYMAMRAIQVVVLGAGAWLVLAGSLTTGGFVAFLLLAGVFVRPLERIAAVIETYPEGLAGFRRYRDLMATEPNVADAPAARPVRRDHSFEVRPGETLAFVGPSGAGKATALALLPRFYEPTAGRITVDGIPVTDLTLASLRRQIGPVSQEVFLFGGTLRKNIAYGRLGATEAEISDAAGLALLGSMIDALPLGLDTVVGERGVTLSGGQRQRAAIARVFLKSPPILILDEATSALDTETEREIQAALERLRRGAPRWSSRTAPPRSATMQDGRIAEIGSHAELTVRGGLYAQLAAA